MTDSAIDAAAFVHPDDELVFDDDEVGFAPPPLPVKPARKAPRKGRAEPDVATETLSATSPEAVVEEPADAPAPVPRPDAAPAGSDPLPRERVPLLLAGIVVFALLTSLIALGALIAVGRSLAAANAARAQAVEQAEAIEKIPAIVRSLDAASTRLSALAAATPAAVAPATAADIHAAVDGLKLSLSQRQAEGTKPVAGTLHDGFSEIAVRLSRIEDRLDTKRR